MLPAVAVLRWIQSQHVVFDSPRMAHRQPTLVTDDGVKVYYSYEGCKNAMFFACGSPEIPNPSRGPPNGGYDKFGCVNCCKSTPGVMHFSCDEIMCSRYCGLRENNATWTPTSAPTTKPISPPKPVFSRPRLHGHNPWSRDRGCPSLSSQVSQKSQEELENDGKECSELRIKVDKTCFDLKTKGKSCVTSCTHRMEAIADRFPMICQLQNECPILWRRYIGREFCVEKGCSISMAHYCGKHKNQVLLGYNVADPKKQIFYSACHMCTHHFIWKSPPVRGADCWLLHQSEFCKPHTKQGSLFAVLAANKVQVQMDWKMGDRVAKVQPALPAHEDDDDSGPTSTPTPSRPHSNKTASSEYERHIKRVAAQAAELRHTLQIQKLNGILWGKVPASTVPTRAPTDWEKRVEDKYSILVGTATPTSAPSATPTISFAPTPAPSFLPTAYVPIASLTACMRQLRRRQCMQGQVENLRIPPELRQRSSAALCEACAHTPLPKFCNEQNAKTICQIPSPRTPQPTAAPSKAPTSYGQKWILGSTGQSCSDACSAMGKLCNSSGLLAHFADVLTADKLKTQMQKAGATCKHVFGFDDTSAWTPGIWPLYGNCYTPSIATDKSRCDAHSQTMQRLCFCLNPPTTAPTSAPTSHPTAAPSSAPTTATPTLLPTQAPTAAPTQKRKSGWVSGMPFMIGELTSNPTAFPTQSPTTYEPTAAPTLAPSMFAKTIWHHLTTEMQWGVTPKTHDDDEAQTSAETAEVDKYLQSPTALPTPKESTNHRNMRLHIMRKHQQWRVEFVQKETQDYSCPFFLKRSRCPNVDHHVDTNADFFRKPDANTFAILRGTIAAADKGQDKVCRACLGMGTADCLRCAQQYMYPVGDCEPHSTQFWCSDGI